MREEKNETLVLLLCEEVRDRRQKLNLSQSEVSRRSGLHRSYIGDLERGARNLSVKNLARVALALNISPSSLVKRAEKRLLNGNQPIPEEAT
ncbi:helix-turn-helix transcriptional regulator [bacterium]|nr:helix-turn-helix transcriptional regulator [bacterium]QQR58340.1 MAG: helix-turn-helix transcriptional regulator [Candidatus Melainabacteria bacterium]